MLIGEELIVTRVKLKHENLSILTNSDQNEWSLFSLKEYEISFLKTFKFKHSADGKKKPEDSPGLMILYEKSGVIAMSVVLKNLKEFDLLYHSLKDLSKVHVNIIEKNSYLEEKLASVGLTDLVPRDYFEETDPGETGTPPTSEEQVSPNKFLAFTELTRTIKEKKVLVDSHRGVQVFEIIRDSANYSASQGVDEDTPEVPHTVWEFLRGYARKLVREYDITSISILFCIYSGLVSLSVFTLPQLIVFSLLLVFAVAKFDLHLARIKNNNKKVVDERKEVYVKQYVPFGREEVADYIEERMLRNRAKKLLKAQALEDCKDPPTKAK